MLRYDGSKFSHFTFLTRQSYVLLSIGIMKSRGIPAVLMLYLWTLEMPIVVIHKGLLIKILIGHKHHALTLILIVSLLSSFYSTDMLFLVEV